MNHLVRSAIFVWTLPACYGERPTGPVDTDPDGPSPDCVLDEECSPGDGYICEDGDCVEGDRNNGFDDAEAVYLETEVSGFVQPEGDVDYFTYQSTGEEWLRIQTTPDDADGRLDTVVAVYTAGGALHAWMDDYPTGNVNEYDTVLYVYLPTAGTWYVSVQDAGTFFDDDAIEEATGDYELLVQPFARVVDEPDSSDAPGVAIQFESDSAGTVWAVGVLLDEPGDSDWIRIDSLPWERAPIEIAGHADIPGSDSTSLVRIYDEAMALLSEKDDVGPDGTVYYFETIDGVPYAVEATDANAEGSPDHWYVLYVRTRDADYYAIDFETEPNDQVDVADPLAPYELEASNGEPYLRANATGLHDGVGDSDWFTIDASVDEYVSVLCSSDAFGSLLDPAVEVYGTEGEHLDTVDDGTDLAPDVYNLGPVTNAGEVSIRVYATSEEAETGPAAYYYCVVTLTPFQWDISE